MTKKKEVGEGIVCADRPKSIAARKRQHRNPPTPRVPAVIMGTAGSFQPGQSGNPAGGIRTIRTSARANLTDLLVRDLTAFYQLRGQELLQRVADDNPALMVSIFARLLPREMHQTTTHIVADISDECRRAMAESWLVANTIDVTPEPDSEPDGDGV